MKRIPIILDGDPGHDDAIAWVLANGSPALDIRAVTTCCGNQTIEKTTYNTLRICTLIDLHVPTAKGRVRPLISDAIIAPTVHGESGLDGPDLPEPDFDVVDMDAVTLMEKVIRESHEPITLVPTGPLTNIAALLLAHPELKENIKQISLMGGGVQFGNWTPAAEFNILVDPEAADVVFKSGIPIIMAGLDVTEKAMIFPEDFERIRALGNHVAVIVADWLEFFYQFHRGLGYEGAPVHDAVAVAALIKPEIMESKDLFVEVETTGDFCKGATIADFYNISGKAPNAKVLMGIDRQAFVDLLVEAISVYGEVAK
ncbi:nucleoside hydrolase [Anaerotignum sp. MB30-C6]|uniref:nucleoside hydrolase n=1 Tax=Anaerotignum sp. MB30-C6 TaxID=3070814 RepID=UPI0027DAE29E|nr:nucleoside hydrolase [Anaerotignum sp. MB30-C6]WMI79847.1 nucleoside hydrolase [Anaerotignum sp. MB30-C6]